MRPFETKQVCSVTDGNSSVSVLSVVEDLARDWSQHNEHSRHSLGAHGFLSFKIFLSTINVFLF